MKIYGSDHISPRQRGEVLGRKTSISRLSSKTRSSSRRSIKKAARQAARRSITAD